MCLLFCFVLFWIFCYVVCEKIKKIKIVDNKKRIKYSREPQKEVRSDEVLKESTDQLR